jgi:hypothetical protein
MKPTRAGDVKHRINFEQPYDPQTFFQLLEVGDKVFD